VPTEDNNAQGKREVLPVTMVLATTPVPVLTSPTLLCPNHFLISERSWGQGLCWEPQNREQQSLSVEKGAWNENSPPWPKGRLLIPYEVKKEKSVYFLFKNYQL
jgi:hypothetical protein